MDGNLKTLLTIAGSDPTGGAGIQADIKVGSYLGLHVLSAVTAVTAQNSHGLLSSGVVPSDLLKAQLDAITQDVVPNAVKIGMIGSKENLFVISDFLREFCQSRNIPVVTDPILKLSADDKQLFESIDCDEMCNLYMDYIFPYSTVITPNIPEFNLLAKNKINTLKSKGENIESLCDKTQLLPPPELLRAIHKNSTVLKGGHTDCNWIQDTLFTKEDLLFSNHQFIDCKNLHGSGCVYSSLFASLMALGYKVPDAFHKANELMESIILRSCNYSLGDSSYGPLNINGYKL